jgi:hypothetical protein
VGATVACAAPGCDTTIHPLCGVRARWLMQVRAGGGTRALCPAHAAPPHIDSAPWSSKP